MSRAKPADDDAPLPESFEAAMTELETLIEQMEAGQLPLEQSLQSYRRGVELVRHCRERLAAVSQQVEVLEAGLLMPYQEDRTTEGQTTGQAGRAEASSQEGFDEEE